MMYLYWRDEYGGRAMTDTLKTGEIEKNIQEEHKKELMAHLARCRLRDRTHFKEHYLNLKTKALFMLNRGWMSAATYQYVLNKAREVSLS